MGRCVVGWGASCIRSNFGAALPLGWASAGLDAAAPRPPQLHSEGGRRRGACGCCPAAAAQSQPWRLLLAKML